MAVSLKHQSDVETIMGKRRQHGADYWSTEDGRLGKGSPFATVDCVLMLTELGMAPTHPVLKATAELLWQGWRDDGRFKIAPKGTIYPCHTGNVARVLCRLGAADDSRMHKTFEHLLSTLNDDGGWRCNKRKKGKTIEGDLSNPGVTLWILDAFRYSKYLNVDSRLGAAVETLLNHWTVRRPLGPCSFGIGSRFLQIEYPFLRYNLFYDLYVLSFYQIAYEDPRFLEALEEFKGKLSNGKVVVESPHRRLAKLEFCKKGQVSTLATQRWLEMQARLA